VEIDDDEYYYGNLVFRQKVFIDRSVIEYILRKRVGDNAFISNLDWYVSNLYMEDNDGWKEEEKEEKKEKKKGVEEKEGGEGGEA
jgi:hypothetical protein